MKELPNLINFIEENSGVEDNNFRQMYTNLWVIYATKPQLFQTPQKQWRDNCLTNLVSHGGVEENRE